MDATLSRGARLILAAKDGLCARAPEWVDAARAGRLGLNAVLGGTGRRFVAELDELRSECRGVALAGNASSTAILRVLEGGGTLAGGIAEARRLGYLEPDPERDLSGADAAVKLAIVVGALRGAALDPAEVRCEDLREVDPRAVRARAERGATTRVVARWDPENGARVACEEVPRTSPLAVPPDRVVYGYALAGDRLRVHVGRGVGPLETARALFADLRALCPVDPAGGAR